MRKSICIMICSGWLLSILGSLSVSMHIAIAQSQGSSRDEARFTPPPGEESPEIKSLISRAQLSLGGGTISPTSLLIDPAFMSAHEWPRFRKLICQYAKANQTTIVTPQEPGEPMLVSGTIRNQLGEPIKGALIYVYQTSAKGWYSDKAPHISGMAGDEKYARLFGYLTTDQDGRYEFRTIRPGGYPRSNLPAHIHIEIEVGGSETRTFISEIQFEDDVRLTREMRDRGLRERLFVFPVKREANGLQRVKADFQI